jgi:hypothetical protein
MEWTITFLSDQHIVVFQTHGVADEKSSLEMAKILSKTMMQYKAKRCVIDHSDIISVSGSSVEMYYRSQELNETGIVPEVKIAEVVRPAHREFFDFLETVFHNRGFEFRVFADKESAIQWLSN